MLALYRSGRQAEALEVYREGRRLLVEELGLEPGPDLQRLQRAILTGDPDLDPPAAATGGVGVAAPEPVPRQLPPDVASFTGREPELVQLDRALAAAGRDGPVVISAIEGTGGIGKSALAVHAAHRLAGRFPDGQLYVDLHGATAGLQPLAPLEVLGRFLRTLGAEPAAVPADLEEASAAFRSRVAGRRLLVVLDNAVDAAQVRPLLPAAAGCGVLVTSRQLLASLDGATHLHLDILPAGDATQLLGRVAGEQRVAAEPQAAAEVARLCGYLPLALRIAGARLAARPGWPLAALAERLADAQRRLDELEVAEAGVRASYDVSYRQLQASSEALDRAAAEAFGLLGVLDGRSWACRSRRGCWSLLRRRPSGSWSAWWTRNCWRPPPRAATGSTTCCACTPASRPPASGPPPDAGGRARSRVGPVRRDRLAHARPAAPGRPPAGPCR